MFIFAGALLLIVASADSALQSGGRSNRETRAALIAHSQLDDVRKWCQVKTPSTQFANFASYPGLATWTPVVDFSGFESRVDLAMQAGYTPSLTSELICDPSDRRKVNNSLLRARIQVRWGLGSGQSLSLVTLIADSRRAWSAATPVVVTPTSAVPSPMLHGASANFTAQGFDENNQVIPDLMFTWSVIPGQACGMFSTPVFRDGHEVTFIHQIPKIPGPGFTFSPPGSASVAATARFCGIEKTGSYVVNLQ